ncbi:YeeE/YedE thiosulfate transporter family protein [uncultured Vibrio sp.]|uniref:YeeE/YedE family protein n=1 Tax=uncultured Vibrio sp. TaxID=114054 RepID=UPI0025CFA7F5|nr:YeeE/YedE thiosulfate transporter family protein [uncultured Vibrio sp.]
MDFTFPLNSLVGGMLLGLSASLLLLVRGKIAGISGIVGGILSIQNKDSRWRLFFIAGMVLSAYLVAPFDFYLPELKESNLLVIALAGVLVGFGTKLANGCTSGHGIIGMGRLSKRSITATMIFMGTAIFVVLFKRLMGWM